MIALQIVDVEVGNEQLGNQLNRGLVLVDTVLEGSERKGCIQEAIAIVVNHANRGVRQLALLAQRGLVSSCKQLNSM